MQHLVLLPGSLCDAALWRHQIACLKGVAELQVGDLSADDTIEGMARRVLGAAPERFALAGLSLGGIVVFEIMRQAPARVTHLALLDTNPQPPRAAQLAAWQELVALAEGGRFAEITPGYLLPSLLSRAGLQDRELVAEVLAMAERVGAAACIRQYRAQSRRPDSRPTLPGIACPTLVLCGQEDALCPVAMHEEMAAAIRHARLVIVAHCGHLSSLERPQAVTAALREWLGTE